MRRVVCFETRSDRTTLMRSDFAELQPHSFSAVIVSQAGKLASKLSPYVGSALIMSCCQVWPCAVVRLSCQLRRRFVVAARAESFWARALPPMRANSVTVSGFFFMPAIYHAAGMQAADIRIAARAFSLKVASQIFIGGDGIAASGTILP